MDDEVLQHVSRPDMPWRAATLTRCGREVAELAEGRVIDVDTARAKVKRLGQQRAAMFLCMTCCNHVGDWPEWDVNPIGRMNRECSGAAYRRDDDPRVAGLATDLRALAILADRHRDEFDAIVAGLQDPNLVGLAQHRARRAVRRG